MKRSDSSFTVRASLAAAIAICIGGCHDDDPPFPAYDTPNSVDVVDMNGLRRLPELLRETLGGSPAPQPSPADATSPARRATEPVDVLAARN